MTYKAMLAGIVGREALNWLNTRITTPGAQALDETTTLDLSKGDCTFETIIRVYGVHPWPETYTVGGALSETGHIYPSVIWDADRKTVWMGQASARAVMGITDDFWL